MDFALETMYKNLIKWSYCSFDRIVIRGHVPVLQGRDGGGVVSWARSLYPDVVLTKSWFESFAAKFHINVKKFAEERHIPIRSVKYNQEKNEIAKQYLPKDQNFVGVYLIIKAREMTSSFASQKSKHNTNPTHRNITRQERCVDHFYFYLVDNYWGPICIRFSSHLPFNVKVFLNGNRWLFREASRKGLKVKADDNVITECNDPLTLQSIADSLNDKKIQSVCDHWVYHLLPVLTYEERNKSKFLYQWFLHQIEYSHNMLFKTRWNLTKLFHRHIGVNYDHFHPPQIETFFGHRHKGHYGKNCNLRVLHQNESVTVIRVRSRSCSLRQYNKILRIFRSELTVNNVKDLKIRKSISNLNKLRERMVDVLCSFQKIQSCVHQATCSRGELSALAKPGSVGRSQTAGIRLDNERIMTLVALLPRLAQYPTGFRISDLQELLCKVTQKNYTTSQVSYDLRKLRSKNLVDRPPGQRRYVVNPRGVSLAAVLPSLADRLCNSLIGISLYPTKCQMPEKLKTPLDQHYYKIENEISSISKTLGLKAA